jgi:hypothetical protein
MIGGFSKRALLLGVSYSFTWVWCVTRICNGSVGMTLQVSSRVQDWIRRYVRAL